MTPLPGTGSYRKHPIEDLNTYTQNSTTLNAEKWSKAYCKQYGLWSNKPTAGLNDACDAFRHAFTTSLLYINDGERKAKHLTWLHEAVFGAADNETKMDFYNNNVGIQIGKDIEKTVGSKKLNALTPQQFRDLVAKKVYEAYKKDQLVTSPDNMP